MDKYYEVVIEMEPIKFTVRADDAVEAYDKVIERVKNGTDWTKKIKVKGVAANEVEIR